MAWITDPRAPHVEHLDGVPWHDAPRPRRWHRCTPHTRATLGFDLVERCTCGAIRNPRFGGGWLERNTRKRGQL